MTASARVLIQQNQLELKFQNKHMECILQSRSHNIAQKYVATSEVNRAQCNAPKFLEKEKNYPLVNNIRIDCELASCS